MWCTHWTDGHSACTATPAYLGHPKSFLSTEWARIPSPRSTLSGLALQCGERIKRQTGYFALAPTQKVNYYGQVFLRAKQPWCTWAVTSCRFSHPRKKKNIEMSS